jgi:hypothetical protein
MGSGADRGAEFMLVELCGSFVQKTHKVSRKRTLRRDVLPRWEIGVLPRARLYREMTHGAGNGP